LIISIKLKFFKRLFLKLENDTPARRINSKEVLLGNDVNLMDLVNQNEKE
jgi:hypothetical protein